MLIVKAYWIALLLIAGNAIAWAQIVGKDLVQNDSNERDRRAIDFGLFVRNLLLKSATASNIKANISRNVLNLKTAIAAPRRRTTTTTTVAPLFFNKGPFRIPFDLSAPINNKFNGGYVNFDYDYGSQQPVRPGRRRRPTTTTTTTTTTTAAPPAATPARRRPIPRRPYGVLGKQKLPPYDYYYDDYDYNYDDVNNGPANFPSAPTPTPAPNPPPSRPAKRPLANRAQNQGLAPQLRNRFVYQFRQPADTSINNNAAQPPAADKDGQQTPNTNSNNVETSTNANDDVYDDGDDVTNDNGGSDNNDNISDNNNPNTEQDYNDSSDNANPNFNQMTNVSAPPPPPTLPNSNLSFDVPQFQGRFSIAEYPKFGASEGFQYSPYNNFNSQYQSPTGYSVRYY